MSDVQRFKPDPTRMKTTFTAKRPDLKSEIRNCELDYDAAMQPVRSKISDFGIETSSNF